MGYHWGMEKNVNPHAQSLQRHKDTGGAGAWTKRILGYTFLILSVSALATILAVTWIWPRGKDFLRRNLAKVNISGVVTDSSTGAPIEMVTVDVNSGRTYTNYQGQFHWEELNTLPRLTLKTPLFYETYARPLECREEKSSKFLERRFSCPAALVPGPEIMAARVVDSEISKGAETEADLDGRYNTLWHWVHPEQKTFLGDWENWLRPTLKTREKILRKLGKKTISFERIGETIYLSSWAEPVNQREYTNVAEVKVRRTDLKGRTSEAKEHFAKHNNLWYYLLPFSQKELVSFVEANSWVLKLKD